MVGGCYYREHDSHFDAEHVCVSVPRICCRGYWVWIGGSVAAIFRKKKAVNRCHGTKPLHAFGTAADLDALSFGLVHGSRCVASCFPLTVLPFIAGGGLGMMAALFAVLLAERARHIPQYGVSAIVLVFLGL